MTTTISSPPRIRLGAEEATPRTQTIWALAGMVMVVVVLATCGVLYLRPPGYLTHTLLLPEAGGLHGGEGVRIAGIPVGRVLALHLREDDVEVEFSVKSSVRLGNRTAADVRMLTPVGGLYLALLPAGNRPLTGSIPADRAHLPFVVNDLVEQAHSVTDRIDTDTLRTDMSGTAAALTHAPDAVRDTLTDLQKVVALLAAQKQQIQDMLGVSDEYLEAVRQDQGMLTEVLRAYALLGPQIVAVKAKVRSFADATATIVSTLFDFLAGPYAAKIEPLLTPLEQTRDAAGRLMAWTDQLTTQLRDTVTELGRLAGPDGRALVDQSGLTVAQPDICLPVPGKAC
ncbi:MlaD family protein [Nocardia vaccinii]|uniref:MlaD family protein n=1 Tax=Nocardia vaccinii TaxID=1822 RepID=UPI00082F7DBD|nr:MlaD family protein [Nocardia vaccinii]